MSRPRLTGAALHDTMILSTMKGWRTLKKISIGTYSFGMSCPLDTAGKLRAAAQMGYSGIELLQNDLALSDAELKAALENAPIDLVSIHARLTEPEAFAAMCARLAPLGLKIAVIPGLNFCDEAETLDAAATLNALGAAAKPYGVKVCYHNHTSEFYPDPASGKPLHETLIEHTDPQTVGIQLDVGWATAAGVDAVAYLRKYPGRFASIHVKECCRVLGTGVPKSAKEPEMAPPKGGFRPAPELLAQMRERASGQCAMGAPESLVDWRAIARELDAQGVDALFVVEREYDYIPGQLQRCLQEDVDWLKANLA